MSEDPNMKILGETEKFAIWVSHEDDVEELIYHIEITMDIGNITLHLYQEEWEEFAEAMMQAMR